MSELVSAYNALCESFIVLTGVDMSQEPNLALGIRIHHDEAINTVEDDSLKRFPFASRVARVIEQDESDSALIVGIFGAWGEGKTTILNFIRSILEQKKQIVCVNFNPWRYGNEETLVEDLFKRFANAVDKKLKSDRTKLAGSLQKMGDIASVVSAGASVASFAHPVVALFKPLIDRAGKTARDKADEYSTIKLDECREEVETMLSEQKIKIVVFIDDIDRLDKSEIHSIFRIVKLTAKFKNVVYVLAFDPCVVSDALGSRYGSGNQKAGEQFLEKVVTVPLHVPKAYSHD